MTATKRHLAVFFAIACVLVLIGGSLKADAMNLGKYQPSVNNVYGYTMHGGVNRQLHVDFQIEGGEGPPGMVVCGFFQHYSRVNGWLQDVERCGVDELWDKGSGRFRATWVVPVKHNNFKRIARTDVRMKIKFALKGGRIIEGDWSKLIRLTW